MERTGSGDLITNEKFRFKHGLGEFGQVNITDESWIEEPEEIKIEKKKTQIDQKNLRKQAVRTRSEAKVPIEPMNTKKSAGTDQQQRNMATDEMASNETEGSGNKLGGLNPRYIFYKEIICLFVGFCFFFLYR